jgi:hypothetical protein
MKKNVRRQFSRNVKLKSKRNLQKLLKRQRELMIVVIVVKRARRRVMMTMGLTIGSRNKLS